MRTEREIKTEIKKMRLVFSNPGFPEKARDNAWAMMLTLQWMLSKDLDKTTRSLSPMELSGITMDQANALKKKVKRKFAMNNAPPTRGRRVR